MFGNPRTNDFAVDIVTTPAVVATPEPSTLCLVGTVFLAFLGSSRIRLKTRNAGYSQYEDGASCSSSE